jgi:hypothetical protein
MDAVCRSAQAEMFAQRAAFILGAEQAAALQLGNHERDEILEAAGQVWRHDVVTVGAIFDEPLFELIGDLRRRTDERPVAACAGDSQIEIADGQVLASRELRYQRLPALAAVRFRQIGQGAIDRLAREIGPDHLGQERQSQHRMHQRL